MNTINLKTLPVHPPGLKPTPAGEIPANKQLALSKPPGPEAMGNRWNRPSLPSLAGGELKSVTGAGGTERHEAAKAAREFEEVFLRYLASAMTESAGVGGDMEGAHFYKGLIDEQFGRLLADSGGGLGLQGSLIKKLDGAGESGHGE